MYLIAAIFGAFIGGMTAKKRKGAILDIAFYAAGYAIAFALITLIVTNFFAPSPSTTICLAKFKHSFFNAISNF